MQDDTKNSANSQVNSTELLAVTIDNKYKVVQEADGRLHALRGGEEWRDLVGDNLVLRMAQRIEKLEDTLSEIINVHVTSHEDCYATQTIARRGLNS